MKKLLFVLACLAATVALCACGGGGGMFSKPTPTPIPQIDPTSLIGINDVAELAGYTPVLDTEGTKSEGNVSTALYRSEPIGQYDTVEVEVTQFTDDISYEQIFDLYEREKAARSSAELIENIGQETYIAFPTIHVYDRGCLVEITAGSGSDEAQKELLRSFAVRAAARLEEIIPEYK